MKRKNDEVYLGHILEAIEKIVSYRKGRSYNDFLKNSMFFDAVVREIEIIGEASARLSEKFNRKYPDLPIKDAIAMRNILVHGYSQINQKLFGRLAKKIYQN